MISPFIRIRVSDTGIITSMCALCHLAVGASADPDTLTIAEIAHNCRNKHAKSSDKAAATPEITQDSLS